jgi:AraC-like DNA-binding protein
MSVVVRRPGPRLRGIVDRLWYVDGGTGSAPDTICPDGRTEIVLHLGDPMREHRNGRDFTQPRHLLVGQMDQPMTVVSSGMLRMVGATLESASLYTALPVSQSDLAGQVIDLESVWGRWTRETAERVAATPDGEGALACFEAALGALFPDSAELNSPIARAVARLRQSGGNASIARLASEVGLGRRQFERRFHTEVGLPPRLFGRIVRFQRAFRAIGGESGAAVAARCGYADQAHLVREIRRFAGRTPTLLAEAEGLTAFFRR